MLYKIRNFFSNKYTDIIIIPYETIKRFFYWGWKLKHNYEWDCCSSIYYMIYLKLNSLIDYSRKHAHLCWNSEENGKEFRKLKIACNLAKRLSENNYNTNKDRHSGKWGEIKMVFGNKSDNGCKECILERPMTTLFPHLKEKEYKEFRVATNADDNQKQLEKEYLYKLLDKYLEGWWD